MQRINVVGTSGSGKSTFSRQLARQLDVPHVELDALFWGPDWQETPDPQFFARIEDALTPPGWVLDGNYTRSIPVKWQRADTVIWLDYPFSLTLYRAVTRALHRSFTRKELWPGTGNHETFRKLFSRDSIVWWTIKTHGQVRQKYQRMMADPTYGHLRFIRLQSPRQAKVFLARFQGE